MKKGLFIIRIYDIMILWLKFIKDFKEVFMKAMTINEALGSNSYPGRGIIIGLTPDKKKSVIAYFIMGRSENSRNRVFVEEGEGIKTQAFDPAKLTDPSLIIYSPVRVYGKYTIVTNGDQTDTIYDHLAKNSTFYDALKTREFEPDAPNFTPRISGITSIENGDYSYSISILKSSYGNDAICNRFTYDFEGGIPGAGHLIHTYEGDGNPLPSFATEPKLVEVMDDMDKFGETLWNTLDADNKVSLYVRYTDIETKEVKSKIINKNQ